MLEQAWCSTHDESWLTQHVVLVVSWRDATSGIWA